jgi:hypothetical protein
MRVGLARRGVRLTDADRRDPRRRQGANPGHARPSPSSGRASIRRAPLEARRLLALIAWCRRMGRDQNSVLKDEAAEADRAQAGLPVAAVGALAPAGRRPGATDAVLALLGSHGASLLRTQTFRMVLARGHWMASTVGRNSARTTNRLRRSPPRDVTTRAVARALVPWSAALGVRNREGSFPASRLGRWRASYLPDGTSG